MMLTNSLAMTLLLAAGCANTVTAALGINCRGSSVCNHARTKNAVKQITNFIANDIDKCRRYPNGQKIACITDGNIFASNGGFCAFLRDTKDGATGEEIQELALRLAERKDDVCNNCGSVPLLALNKHGRKNDPKAGILTFNFVKDTDNPCPTRLC